MTAQLRSRIITHEIETKDKQTPRSLKVTTCLPYFFTRDSLGIKSRLWVVESEDREPGEKNLNVTRTLCELDPPLPAQAEVQQLIVYKRSGLIVLPYLMDRWDGNNFKLMVYKLDTGELVEKLDMPGHWIPMHQYDCPEEDVLITLRVVESSQHVSIHGVTSEGLTERGSFPLEPDIKADYRGGPMLFTGFSAGEFITIQDSVSDYGNMVLNYYEPTGNRLHQAKYPLQDAQRFNIQRVRDAVLSDRSRLTLLVTEENWNDMGFMRGVYTSTIYSVELPTLGLAWKTTFSYKLCQIFHSPQLGLYLLTSKENTTLTGLRITLVEASTGHIMKEISIPNCLVNSHISVQDDELIIVERSGRALIQSLDSLLKDGVPLTDDGRIDSQSLPIGPEPYNKKTRKMSAEGAWDWVDNAVISSKMAVLFHERGLDMYVIQW